MQFPAVAMDFDHLPEYPKTAAVTGMIIGTARYTLPDGSTRKYTLEEIAAEIAKCELVCANCHRVRTSKRTKWAAAAAEVSA